MLNTSPTLTSVLNVIIVNAEPKNTISETKTSLIYSSHFLSGSGILYSTINSGIAAFSFSHDKLNLPD